MNGFSWECQEPNVLSSIIFLFKKTFFTAYTTVFTKYTTVFTTIPPSFVKNK